jgi:hypothetical protein
MSRLAAKISRWRALSAPERRALLLSLAALPLIVVGLRVAGLARVLALLRSPARPTPSGLEAARIAAVVSIAANHLPFEVNCLPRSVLLQWLLRRHGLEGQLRIGVRPPDGDGLLAHAWVECGGQPIGDSPPLPGYVPFEAKL